MSIRSLTLAPQTSTPAAPSGGRKLFLNGVGKLFYLNTNGTTEAVGTLSYSELQNIPSSFTPSAHEHTLSELSNNSDVEGLVVATDGQGDFQLIELDAAAASFKVLSADHTAEAGEKIAADTSSGSWTLTLPSNPTAGQVVEVLDFSESFLTNSLTVDSNGAFIEGSTDPLVCNVAGASFYLVYTGPTRGWQVVTMFSAISANYAPLSHTHSASDISDFASAAVAAAPPTTNASLLTSGTLDDARLSTAVQTSLGKADSASQPGHEHDASDIDSGTLAHERGGLEADVSTYEGLVKISGGGTSAVQVNGAINFGGSMDASNTAATSIVAGNSNYEDLLNSAVVRDSAGSALFHTVHALSGGGFHAWRSAAGLEEAGNHLSWERLLLGATDSSLVDNWHTGNLIVFREGHVPDTSTISGDAPTIRVETAKTTDNVDSTVNRDFTFPATGGTLVTLSTLPVELVIACSDETSNLTAGTKVTFRSPYAFTLTEARASLTEASLGSPVEVDVRNAGVSVFTGGGHLYVADEETTTETEMYGHVIDNPNIGDDAEITIHILQIGTTAAGKGLKVVLKGTRA